MNIGKKEIGILLILLGIVSVILTYYLGVTKFKDLTNQVNGENGALQTEVDMLTPVAEHEADYVSENTNMLVDGKQFANKYVGEFREEDEDMYAVYLEGKIGLYISYLDTVIPVDQAIAVPEREDALSDVQDLTGSIAARGEMANPDNMLVADDLSLGMAATNIHFSCTYDQFKELVRTVVNDEYTKSIDGVNIGYDPTTGILSGNMTINYYVLNGKGDTYVEPATGVNAFGLDCIFGSLFLTLDGTYQNTNSPVKTGVAATATAN